MFAADSQKTSSSADSSCSSSSSSSSSSTTSGASVDEERMGRSVKCHFGADPAFEEERKKLAERISAPSGVMTGGCEHKTRLLERIGGGSFGDVYLGEMVDSKRRVAVKIEPMACAFQSLLHEGNVYRKLQKNRGIPEVYWYGLHGRDFTALVMNLMGPTLYERWHDCGERFSLKTVLMLADQMLDIMRSVHMNNFVHRDISPNNFMFGLGEKSLELHLIDFGHAKEVPSCPLFVPARRQRFGFSQPMVGTPRFASVFTQMGLEPSYRDDLESLGYIWIYLLKGRLPWQGLRPGGGLSKLDLIGQTKLKTPLEVLCEGVPLEFAVYMNYVRNLKHLEMPNHADMREFFRDLAATLGIEYDRKYDWTLEKENGNDVTETETQKAMTEGDRVSTSEEEEDSEGTSGNSGTNVSN